MLRQRSLAPALLLAVSIVACQKDADLPISPPLSASRNVVGQVQASRPDEQIFADIQSEAPTFGGYFIDPGGNLTAYTTSTADGSAAIAAIRRRIGSQVHLPARVSASVRVIHGDYTFKQLSDWRDSAFLTLLGKMSGVVYDDLDEKNNRVTIGIAAGQEAVESSVLARLATANIPVGAIRFESVKRPTRTIGRNTRSVPPAMMTLPQDLRSWSDSLIGGVRITWYDANNHSNAGACTVGATASFSNGSRGFVTASHCSSQMWGTDNSRYYQPSDGFSNSYVGYEAYDLNAGTCPLFWPCAYYRYSDANLVVDTSTSRHWAQGIIARPSNRVFATLGQVTWDTSNPYLFIVGTATNVFDGQSIEKIGATSGWTYGTVTGTCMDINWFTNDLDKCSYRTSLLVRGGDSGAPVFTWDQWDGIVLYGISFQGDTTGSTSYFSKWSYVTSELTGPGSFTSSINVETNITMSGTVFLSGSVNSGAALSWTGVTVSNSPTSTVYKVVRSTWDASTYTWLDNGSIIASPTSLSYTDHPPINIYSTSSNPPNPCVYSYVSYGIIAYNSGRQTSSGAVYFVGDANGANPGQISCQ